MRTDKLQKQSRCHCPGCQPTGSRFRFQARQFWILDGQSSTETGFLSQSTSVHLPVLFYHYSTMIHLSPTLY